MRDLSNHGLAINEARLHLERVHGLDDEREARCLIVTGGVAGHQPIAIVFDFVNPVRAGRWPLGR